MAHYVCSDCLVRSAEVRTQAEADQLLKTHQRHFCRPARPTIPPPATARTGRR